MLSLLPLKQLLPISSLLITDCCLSGQQKQLCIKGPTAVS